MLKSTPGAVVSIVVLAACAFVLPSSAADMFAEIARTFGAAPAPKSFARPVPLAVTNGVVFAWNGGASAAARDEIDTPAKLTNAVAALRARMAPFLSDRAPAFTDVRVRVPVTAMQFRRATTNDDADILHTLAGKGTWETVRIPHYTGPGEQAVAWYRYEFTPSAALLAARRQVAHFNGVEYFADVFLNGSLVGSHEGFFEAFECDLTRHLHPGGNVLLVRVRNSSRMPTGSSPDCQNGIATRTYGEKIQSANSLGWDDPRYGWNSTPNGFGISQDVWLEGRSHVSIGDIFPRPVMSPDGAAPKSVALAVDVENPDEQNRTVVLKASVYGLNFATTVVENVAFRFWRHNRGDTCAVEGTRPTFRLTIPMDGARVWSPDSPWLYTVRIGLYNTQGQLLDAASRAFGMRSFVQRLDSVPKGRFCLNGQEIRLRGGNEMGSFQQDVFRHDDARLIGDILIAKLTHMNFLRCTQTVMPSRFYDFCDRLGFLAQTDLPVFCVVGRKQYPEVLRQAAAMARLVRAHPSNALVSLLNEPAPRPGGNGHAYGLTTEETGRILGAAATVIGIENPDQVVKFVDGDYVNLSPTWSDKHVYCGWYGDGDPTLHDLHSNKFLPVNSGWMFGCGEFGCEGLESPDFMRRRFPADWTKPAPDGSWRPNRLWGSQTWEMSGEWYVRPRTMEEWSLVSQTHQANVTRLKTEAFRRMPRLNSFAIHLLIDAWPNGWQKSIMDCERTPKLAWYEYRKALEPLAVQVRAPWRPGPGKLAVTNAAVWSYQQTRFTSADTNATVEIWICNDVPGTPPAAELVYQLEVDGKAVLSGHAPVTVPTIAEAAAGVGRLPIPTASAVGARHVVPVPPRDALLRVSLVDPASRRVLAQTTYPIHYQETK